MSSKKQGIFITFEVNCSKVLDVYRFCGMISDVDLEALFSLMDKLNLKIFDSYKLNKYTPTKEDLEK